MQIQTGSQPQRDAIVESWRRSVMARLEGSQVSLAPSRKLTPRARSIEENLGRLFDQLMQLLVNGPAPHTDVEFHTNVIARHFAAARLEAPAAQYPYDLAQHGDQILEMAALAKRGEKGVEIGDAEQSLRAVEEFEAALHVLAASAKRSYQEARELIEELKARESQNPAFADLAPHSRCPSAFLDPPAAHPSPTAPA